MRFEFFKYQGTGNDFVMIDNRQQSLELSQKEIEKICDRRFGVGADGLILLENEDGFDFKMVYYNSDGNPSTMCGNGGRCIVKFASDLKIINNTALFLATDGPHNAHIEDDLVHLKMLNTQKGIFKEMGSFIDTGSPHHVVKVNNIDIYNVFEEGRRLRNEVYGNEGANVNFVEVFDEHSIYVRTYERGVEDETYSCGTGVCASSLIAFQEHWLTGNEINVKTKGGHLKVTFDMTDDGFENVYLIGPAERTFEGVWEV